MPGIEADITALVSHVVPNVSWTTVLVHSQHPFAVTAVSGRVYVSSAMLSLVNNYDELAFVAALAAASYSEGLHHLGSDITNGVFCGRQRGGAA